jgi:hypothetical protein
MDQANLLSKKVKDNNERAASEAYKATYKNNEKKSTVAGKGVANIAKGIPSDLSYQTMLSQHIKSNFDDPNSLPADILMQFGLPK